MIYAVESETASGWCLPEAQLAISGIQVARAIYDTLVQPDASGEMAPMLAESVEPNDTFDSWTILLRQGVTFHDGTDLTAEVVKNNLDAYRGAYEGRSSLLFLFVLDHIDTVEATDDLTVTVTTKTPWPAFPSFLWSDGRLGIVGQAQLDDAEECDENLVGTGPFVKTEWKVNDHFSAEKNPDYWQEGEDGKPLPYLDEIEFRPQGEQTQRIEGVATGTYDAAHIENGDAISQAETIVDEGLANLITTFDFAEVAYLLLNESKAPFDNLDARLAVASALDREALNQTLNQGKTEVASGPFAPGSMGYVEDTPMPPFDLSAAKKHVAAYEQATGQKLSFVAPSPGGGGDQSAQELIQSQLAEAGIEMKLQTMEQSASIDRAIAGDFDMMKRHRARFDHGTAGCLLFAETAVGADLDIFAQVGVRHRESVALHTFDFVVAGVRAIAVVPGPYDASVVGHIARCSRCGCRKGVADIDLLTDFNKFLSFNLICKISHSKSWSSRAKNKFYSSFLNFHNSL